MKRTNNFEPIEGSTRLDGRGIDWSKDPYYFRGEVHFSDLEKTIQEDQHDIK